MTNRQLNMWIISTVEDQSKIKVANLGHVPTAMKNKYQRYKFTAEIRHFSHKI